MAVHGRAGKKKPPMISQDAPEFAKGATVHNLKALLYVDMCVFLMTHTAYKSGHAYKSMGT